MDTQLQPQGPPVGSSAVVVTPPTPDEIDEAQAFLRRYRSSKAQRVLRMMGPLRVAVAFITINGLFWGTAGQVVIGVVQVLWLFAESWASGHSDERLLAYVNALSIHSAQETITQLEILHALNARGLMSPPESPPTKTP